ncbi:MAG: TonB-dependent hemoglobin/transferrin/lactoferrin family receptor [Burkholderiales bacterium]|nr:TonB-dependent hemoglobin/transferrin/lactoferrin family receptor [Burkholderiales bacterium]
MQTKLKILAVMLALALMAHQQEIWAADENDEDGGMPTLDPIVISATRTEARLSKIPASVSVATKHDFEEQQAGTVADVMKKLPNVDFGGGPRTNGQIPTIRGYQGPSITLLVDGARRNANFGLTSPLFLDPYFLGRAEVVRGPSSSLYGSGGNGGAMVFTTLNAKDLLKAGQNMGADVKAGYSSGDTSHHYNARIYGESGRIDALLAVGVQDFNDIRQAGGTTLQLNSGHGNSALVKLGLQASDQLRFELSQQNYQKQSLQPNNPQIVTAGQTQLNHINQDETVLKVSTVDENGEKELDARIYRSALRNKNDPNIALAATLVNTSNRIETTGASIQNTTRITSDGLGMHRMTYGLDTYQDKLNSITGSIPNTIIPDGKAKVSGAFLQDEIAVGALRITPSARYDQFTASATYVASPAASFSHVSPKLAMVWQTTDQLSLFGSYGQAYRAPTVTEMYTNSLVAGVAATTNFFNFSPNPNLKPETDTTLEIGANFAKGQLFSAEDNLKVRATLFQSKAKDMINTGVVVGTFNRTGFGRILLGPTGTIFQAQNVSSATRNGVELEGGYTLNVWKINANYSRLRVKDDTTGNSLFAPPDKLAAQLHYAIPAADMSVLWGVTAVAAQDYDSTLLRRRSGYTVHDLYMSWEPRGRIFRIDFGIGNLFDKRYMVYQSGNALTANTYEMGRNYKLTLSGSF